MPSKCSVLGCRGNYDNENKVHIFSFPQDPDIRSAWVKALSRKDFVYSKNARVCERHFVPEDIEWKTSAFDEKNGCVITAPLLRPRLKPNAIPKLSLAHCETISKETSEQKDIEHEKKCITALEETSHSSKPDDAMDDDDGHGHSGEEEEEEAGSGVDSLEELQKRRSIQSGRGVTLSMLMSDGILEAGEGFLTIDYLGAKFIGDLLPGGKIRAQETQKIFSSPSSWAIHCKKLLNPDKKSGCGWSSMRYKGKKLDTYKNLWFRKHKQEQEKEAAAASASSSTSSKGPLHGEQNEEEKKNITGKKWDIGDKMQNTIPRPRSSPQKRIIVPHSVLGNRSFAHDMNTLVKCTPFSSLDRIQPFTVTIATNCLLLIDFHCHIIKNEVVGYLGGNWDIASHNLAVLQAFPCRSGLGDKDSAARVEDEIRRSLERRHLSVVGWYHSHPTFPAQPTIKDVDSQMEYQITMKGDSDSSYTPCLGLICSPYDSQKPTLEADYLAYWVMPPPEHRPHEYGRPMQMIYSIAHDSFLTQDLLMEMRLISEYYRSTGEALDFNTEISTPGGGTYWEKLQTSLRTKLPRDLMVTGAQSTAQAQAVTHFWDFLKDILKCRPPIICPT